MDELTIRHRLDGYFRENIETIPYWQTSCHEQLDDGRRVWSFYNNECPTRQVVYSYYVDDQLNKARETERNDRQVCMDLILQSSFLSIQFQMLLEQLFKFRDGFAMLYVYDWVKVGLTWLSRTILVIQIPLVYTQVGNVLLTSTADTYSHFFSI